MDSQQYQGYPANFAQSAPQEDLGVQTPLVPKGTKSKFAQFQLVYKKPDFLVTWIIPWVVFTTTASLYTYGFMTMPSICILVAVAFFFVGVILLALRGRGHVWFPLGITTVFAVMIGVMTGLFVYENFACFSMFYAHSRLYTSVVPSQPASGVADAAGLTFTGGTFVDIEHASGYASEAGYVYCAAPVVDNNANVRIQYWAVGVDCCSADGGFKCDQSKNENAKAGIRVFDNSGWFSDSNFDFYQKARKKAEASYGLVSVKEPLFLRWVAEDNLNMLRNNYSREAALAIIGFILLYLALSAAFSFALYRPRPAKPKANLSQWPSAAKSMA